MIKILFTLLFLCVSVSAQELPREFINTNIAPVTGISITASSGANLQTIINSAKVGDEIVLPTGAAFTGNFTLPVKAGSGLVLIRWSEMPPVGVRVSPEYSGRMPKLITPNADPVVRTLPGAHHYRFIGIEFTTTNAITFDLIRLGDSKQTVLADVPSDIIIDRCYVHGTTTGDLARCVALNGSRLAVIDSYVSDCHWVGADSQALCGWAGPGPFKIVNNYLEGAAENVMFGGADPKVPNLVPSDIEFRKNHCFKPLSWKLGHATYAGKRWSIKNIFELKNARRVLVDGNTFENNWVDGQNGTAILFTVRNQEGTAPWSVVEDVTFTNNILRHASAAINILGKDYNNPSQQVKRIKIKNNLFEDIGGPAWGGNGVFLTITEALDVTVDHNTILHKGNVIIAYGVPSERFIYTNNLSAHNEYGVIGDGSGPGLPSISKYFPSVVFKKNVLAGGVGRLYPPDNFFDAYALQADFKLASPATYKAAATDGKDIGADMVEMLRPTPPAPVESDLDKLERLRQEMGEIIKRLKGGL